MNARTWFLFIFMLTFALSVAVGAEKKLILSIPPSKEMHQLATRADQLVLIQSFEMAERGMVVTPSDKVIVQGAKCAPLITQLLQSPEGGPPVAGTGYLAILAVLDKDRLPLFVLHLPVQGNSVTVDTGLSSKGKITVNFDNPSSYVSNPDFKKRIYDHLHLHEPALLAEKQAFYKKLGTTLEEMMQK